MLSLTLVDNPSAFLPWYSPNTKSVSLTVLGLSALGQPFVWDLVWSSWGQGLFCSSLPPPSPIQPDQGRC